MRIRKRPLASSLVHTPFSAASQSGLTAICLTVRAQGFNELTSTHGAGSAAGPGLYNAVPLPKSLLVNISRGENPVIGMDSTGLKVCGEEEWKVRRHGRSRRRTWRRLHVCVDLRTQEVLSVALTGNDENDAAGSCSPD